MNYIKLRLAIALGFLFVLCQPSTALAQSLKQYIPQNSSVVMGINWQRLENKLSFTQFNVTGDDKDEYTRDPFMELLIKILDNPKEFGLDLSEQTYFFQHQGDTFDNKVMVLALADKSNFMDKSKEWIKTNNRSAEYIKTGNTHRYAYGDMVINCTNDLAIILVGRPSYSYGYNYGYDYAETAVEEEENDGFNYWSERRKTIRQIDSFRNSDNDPYAEAMAAGDMDEVIMDVVEQPEPEYYETTEEPSAYEEEAAEAVEMESYDEEEYYEVEVVDDYESYDYDRHPLMKALNEKRDKIEAIAEEKRKQKEALRLIGEVNRYLKLKTNETNATNAKFNSAMNKDHDLTFWVNPQILNVLYSRGMRRQLIDRRRDAMDTATYKAETSFDRIMKDNYNYAYGDFDKGTFKMQFVQERNKELQEFNYVRSEKINQNMLNYLNNETFGYWSTNTSIQDVAESYRKVMTALIESMPLRTQYTAQFEMMDIFINKDIFYNTLKGDAVFAFTGLSKQIKTREKYVYNEETFEREYKEVSDTTLFPEMLFMGSIAKQENVDRLILAMEHMAIFKKIKENVYEVLDEPHGSSTNFYVAHHNGLLFVTNNSDLIFKHLESGLPKDKQLTGSGKDLLTKYGNCQYWNSTKSFDAILSMGTSYRQRDQSKIKVLQKHLSIGSMYTVNNGGTIETHANLNFSDATINSLSELVSLLHELEIAR